jgi:hypothetical protein
VFKQDISKTEGKWPSRLYNINKLGDISIKNLHSFTTLSSSLHEDSRVWYYLIDSKYPDLLTLEIDMQVVVIHQLAINTGILSWLRHFVEHITCTGQENRRGSISEIVYH